MQQTVRITTTFEHNEEVQIDFEVEFTKERTRDTSFEEFYWEVDWFEVLDWTSDDEVSDEAIEEWLLYNLDTIKTNIEL